MNPTRLIVLAVICFSSIVCTQERTEHGLPAVDSQILSVLRTEFQKRNPIIGRVELFDVRPLQLNPINYPEKPNHYLVVARGIRSDLTYKGSWEDELMGLFLFDDSLRTIKHTVAYIPTQHWGDFIVKIVNIRKDSVTVRGYDLQSGDTTNFVNRYSLIK